MFNQDWPVDQEVPPGLTPLRQPTRLFFREVWYFPLAYMDARRYLASLGDEDVPIGITSFGEGEVTKTWVGQPASWCAALMGALPFLLFGLAHMLYGVAELGGYSRPTFNLLDVSLNRLSITLTVEMGVYFFCALGLLFGVLKGFPRWSYAYLGMSLYFSWSYNQQNYYGLFYNPWAWLPVWGAIVLGLLLARSLQPLSRLLQGTWNDWTRLSLAIYAFALPMVTVIFFDDDWGILQLYGLFFNTVLLATGAVAFLRSRSTWGRMLSLLAAVLILVYKGLLGVWSRAGYRGGLIFIIIYFGFLLLPAVIGVLRRGVDVLSSR